MAVVLHLLVASMLWVTVDSCPLSCQCRTILLDYRSGKEVDCSYLYMDSVPSISQGTLRLDFSDNSLESVPVQALRGLGELRELDLSDNRIQGTVPDDAFQQNIRLITLDLSRNHIEAISPDAFVGLGRLAKLDLHDNLISTMSTGVLLTVPVTTLVCLGENHWDCGCQLFEAISQRPVTNRNSELTCEGEEPACVSPPGLYEQPISSMVGEVVCAEKTTTVRVSTTKSSTMEPEDIIIHSTDQDGGNGSDSDVNSGSIPNLAVIGSGSDGGVLTKELITYVAVILGAMLLTVFLVLVVVVSRFSSKRRRLEDQRSDSWVYPWPLLQSQRRLPARLPRANPAPPTLTVYDEIPFSMNDYGLEPGSEEAQMTQLKNDQSLPLDKGKLECLETNQAHAEGFAPDSCGGAAAAKCGVYASAVVRADADTAAYVPMHSARPDTVTFKDLYAPSGAFN